MTYYNGYDNEGNVIPGGGYDPGYERPPENQPPIGNSEEPGAGEPPPVVIPEVKIPDNVRQEPGRNEEVIADDGEKYYKPGSTMHDLGFRTESEYMRAQSVGADIGVHEVTDRTANTEGSIILFDSDGNPLGRYTQEQVRRAQSGRGLPTGAGGNLDMYLTPSETGKYDYRVVVKNSDGKEVLITPKQAERLDNASSDMERLNIAKGLGLVPLDTTLRNFEPHPVMANATVTINGKEIRPTAASAAEYQKWLNDTVQLPNSKNGERIGKSELARLEKESPGYYKTLTTKGLAAADDEFKQKNIKVGDGYISNQAFAELKNKNELASDIVLKEGATGLDKANVDAQQYLSRYPSLIAAVTNLKSNHDPRLAQAIELSYSKKDIQLAAGNAPDIYSQFKHIENPYPKGRDTSYIPSPKVTMYAAKSYLAVEPRSTPQYWIRLGYKEAQPGVKKAISNIQAKVEPVYENVREVVGPKVESAGKFAVQSAKNVEAKLNTYIGQPVSSMAGGIGNAVIRPTVSGAGEISYKYVGQPVSSLAGGVNEAAIKPMIVEPVKKGLENYGNAIKKADAQDKSELHLAPETKSFKQILDENAKSSIQKGLPDYLTPKKQNLTQSIGPTVGVSTNPIGLIAAAAAIGIEIGQHKDEIVAAYDQFKNRTKREPLDSEVVIMDKATGQSATLQQFTLNPDSKQMKPTFPVKSSAIPQSTEGMRLGTQDLSLKERVPNKLTPSGTHGDLEQGTPIGAREKMSVTWKEPVVIIPDSGVGWVVPASLINDKRSLVERKNIMLSEARNLLPDRPDVKDLPGRQDVNSQPLPKSDERLVYNSIRDAELMSRIQELQWHKSTQDARERQVSRANIGIEDYMNASSGTQGLTRSGYFDENGKWIKASSAEVEALIKSVSRQQSKINPLLSKYQSGEIAHNALTNKIPAIHAYNKAKLDYLESLQTYGKNLEKEAGQLKLNSSSGQVSPLMKTSYLNALMQSTSTNTGLQSNTRESTNAKTQEPTKTQTREQTKTDTSEMTKNQEAVRTREAARTNTATNTMTNETTNTNEVAKEITREMANEAEMTLTKPPFILPRKANDKQKRDFLAGVEGLAADRRGQLGGKDVWLIAYYPYGPKDKTTLVGEPPEGAVSSSGKGSMYRSAQLIKGIPPDKPVFFDTGARDTILEKSDDGKRMVARTVPDRNVSEKERPQRKYHKFTRAEILQGIRDKQNGIEYRRNGRAHIPTT